MKQVVDIRGTTAFQKRGEKYLAISLPFYWHRVLTIFFAKVFRLYLIAAIIFVFWNNKSGFVFAPLALSSIVQGASSKLSEEEQKLEEELRRLEKEIDEYDKGIQRTRQEKASLERDISLLESQIQKLALQLKATDLQIKRLSSRIRDTQSAIYESQLKIARKKEALANSLQAIYEADQVSLLEMLLSGNNISDFFANVNAIYALQLRVRTELDQVYALKKVLEDQESILIDAKEEQVALLLIQQAQKEDADNLKKTKSQLLTLTQGKEALYQQLKQKAIKTAAEIRAQLFRLRGGGELSFGEAYAFAKEAAALTGVRPALILAVLSQESAFGRNIGRCTWRNVMHPTRDQPAFLQITEELGIDPDKMPVSCPILSDGSYGGAMGIAQFLPSTWMLYKERIQKIVGHIPSPWNPRDAFIATALYLADAGATSQTFEAERQAAAKYYAGSRWQRFLRSYGDRVMNLAEKFQEEINILENEARW